MTIPKAFRTGVKKFPTKQKQIRLNVLSGTSASANGVIRVSFPVGALIDMESFQLTGTLSCPANTSALSYALIKRAGFNVNGTNVGYQNSHFPEICHSELQIGSSDEWSKSNVGFGYDAQKPLVNGDQWVSKFHPFSLCTAGLLSTAQTGYIEADFQLSGVNAVSINKAATGVTPTFSLSDIRAYVNVIEVPEFYASMMASAVRREGGLVKLVEMAYPYEQVALGSNTFNVSSECVDEILVLPKTATYDGSQVIPEDGLYQPLLNCQLGATSKVYVQVNSENFPEYGENNSVIDLASMSANAYGKGLYNYNKLFIGSDGNADVNTLTHLTSNYQDFNAIVKVPLGYGQSAVTQGGICTGMDLSGMNSIVRVAYENRVTNARLIMASLCTSKLVITEDRVGFIQ